MKKKIVSILILMIILIQSTGVILSQVIATTTTNSEQAAKIDYFDITAKININENTRNAAYYGGRSQETTILDHNGNINFVYFDSNNVYIQRLNSNMTVKDTLTIAKKYPKYGSTIVDSSGNYYIAWGQNDLEDGDTGKITFSIAKYNNSGTFIKSYDVCNSSTAGATQVIFDLDVCNMDISKNGILAYNYGKQMKNGHQCNSTGYVDINTMEAPDKYKAYPYTSHSMYTDVIALSTGEFVFMQQGDGYSRGYNLTLISEDKDDGYWLNHSIVPFHFREGPNIAFGYNNTFANYGGMEELDTGVALIAGSEKTLSLDPAKSGNENEPRNVFVQIIKKSGFNGPITADNFVTVGERASTGTQQTSSGNIKYFLKQGTKDYGVKWLTNYSSDYSAKNVKTVEVDNDRIAIFWTKTPIKDLASEDDEVYYMVIDNKGSIVQEATLLEMGSLPGYEKPVYKDGYVYFSNTDGTNKIRTYRVKLYETEDKTEITVPYTSRTINAPITFKIGATVNNGKELEYSSSKPSVLEVSSDGTVTTKKNGTATITISVKNNPRVKKTISMVVDILPQGVTLDKTNLKFDNSNYQTLSAKVDPIQAEVNFVWTSSNNLVARTEKVSSNPNLIRIYPVGQGSCTITVSIEEAPYIQAICEVTVIQKVTGINITDYEIEIASGEKYQLDYTVTPIYATNQEVTWSSSDEKVAKVDQNGLVTGVSDGEAKITATSNENTSIKDTCYVDVKGKISGNYSYEKLDDGTIRVLKYKGNETKVNIPSKIDGYTVTEIGSRMFGELNNRNSTITSITIPETITNINSSALAYCDAITTITVPKSVKEIGVNAFMCCAKLEEIKVDEENTEYISKDGILFEKRDDLPTYLVEYPAGKKDTTYTVPNSVQGIRQWAITSNEYIKEITIPEYTYSMSYRSIYDCPNLTKVYILYKDMYMLESAINECEKVTIYSKKDSKAQTFAEENNIPFEVIDMKITSLKVTPGTMTFTEIGKSMLIKAEVTPDIITKDGKIEYVSENENVATVTSVGSVRAKGNGTTKILVKTTDGSNLTKEVNVVVNVKCSSLSVSSSKIIIRSESPVTVRATAYPTNASNRTLKYSIKDTSIATIDQSGKITPIKNGETTIIVETTDGSNLTKEVSLTVTGIEKKLPFKDVKNTDWFFDSVDYCYEKGIILGTSDTTFNPNTKLTRGMLVTILHRMDGKPTPTTQNKFKDVYKSQYYYDAVIWATEKGIVHGYGDGTKFGPDNNITRQDLAVILRNYAQYKGKNVNVTSDLSKFSDGNLVSDYAKSAVQWAVGKGVITGNSGGKSLTPHSNSTRAEASGMIYNYCAKVK